MGIRDGSFSHFSFEVKLENGNEGRFLFPLFVFEKWEKEPSLIPIFPLSLPKKVGKGTVPDSHFSHLFLKIKNLLAT